MKIKILSSFLSFLLLSSVMVSCSSEPAAEDNKPSPNNDIILVLDTSLSMVGKASDAKNIMPQVKDRLSRFIETARVGDTFTFITFDTTSRVYPTIEIRNESDINVIKSFISQVEAEGMWTYTMEMLRDVLKKADDIRFANQSAMAKAEEEKRDVVERKQVIVILTDALDDPPPSDKNKRLSIEDVASEHSGEDWFVYFVSLGELTDNEKIMALQSDLDSNILAESEVIDASGDIDGGVTAVEESVETIPTTRRHGRPVYQAAWFYLILIFLVILIIGIIYAVHTAKIKLAGILEYRNKVVLGSKYQKTNLERYDARRITIGKDSLCELRIADFESHLPICLEAALVKGELFIFVNTDRGIKVQITEGKGDSFLSDGAVFEAGGYVFRYIARK
ncbi:MAG: VWA domain-containing protein [Spirochaetes bacterium]|jgi:hypothetical protein|nr:VWA domain-containing protein [Spirochaetota bacterium]